MFFDMINAVNSMSGYNALLFGRPRDKVVPVPVGNWPETEHGPMKISVDVNGKITTKVGQSEKALRPLAVTVKPPYFKQEGIFWQNPPEYGLKLKLAYSINQNPDPNIKVPTLKTVSYSSLGTRIYEYDAVPTHIHDPNNSDYDPSIHWNEREIGRGYLNPNDQVGSRYVVYLGNDGNIYVHMQGYSMGAGTLWRYPAK